MTHSRTLRRMRWRHAFIPLAQLALFLGIAACGSAAEAKINFEIPATAGDKALKLLTEQSGVEVVFGTATMAAVKTNGIKGEYTPREAIRRLLEGTGLIVVPNEKTGALTISRDPNAQRAAQSKSCDRPIIQNPPRLAQILPNP